MSPHRAVPLLRLRGHPEYAGGDIVALDSAGYGPLTINKALNVIVPEGLLGGVTVTTTSGTGIAIAAAAGDVVRLKGIHLVSLASNTTGISVGTCKRLEIKNVDIEGFGTGLIVGM